MRNFGLHTLLGLAVLGLLPISAHAQQALRGDVDGDGRVTAADAQAVRDHVAGRPARAGITLLPNGDANGDGRITGVDAAIIQAFAAGRDLTRFGMGEGVKGEPKNGGYTVLHECTVDVQAGTQSCATPRPSGGASADLIVGKPYIAYVTTGAATSRANPADEDTTRMNVALTSQMGQLIGTTDGVTAAASGNRVFFADVPRVTAVASGTLASASV
ncbi:MAG TPA: dockerin type I repeat-containing protein, partial [Longimicrobium sp.]